MNDQIASLLPFSEEPSAVQDERMVIMNELFRQAPESDEVVEVLKDKGWEEFFSFTLVDRHGRPEVEDIKYALDEIQKARPESIKGDYDIVQAKYGDIKQSHPFWGNRIRALMKKSTETRAEWNRQMGYNS